MHSKQNNMKSIFLSILFIFINTMLFAQIHSNSIIGTWLNGEGTGKIEIYKTNSGHYAGKIIWLKEPIDPETGKPKLDKRNPDKSKRSNPTLGLVNMYGFTYNESEQDWENGKIYDPKNGKEYSCKISMKDNNAIKVRGYIGITLIGRTDTWTRLK